MKSLNSNYIPQLDHLRFFAALSIILFHIAHTTLIKKLHFEIGVDLFFTLSGFLFFIIAEESNKTIVYSKFIYNRFLRIYPLVIVLFFLATVVMRRHFTFIDYFNLFGLNLTGNGQISWIAGDWGYTDLSFNWWTVGVEFIFYLIFPFLFKFYKENGILILVKLMLLIIILRYGLYYTFLSESGWKNLTIELNYSVFGHMDTFLAGMITASFYLNNKNFLVTNKFVSSKLLFFALLGCVELFLWYVDINVLLYPTIVGFICGLMILTYILAFKNTHQKISSYLSYLGSISFSLYLLHSFVEDALVGFGLSPYISEKMTSFFHFTPAEVSLIMALFFYFPLIVLLASLSYSTVEKPFLQMRVSYFK